MKVLIYANRLTIGGEQIQAIDLAGAVRDRGHEVLISAPTPGPLVEWATQRGLEVAPLGVPEQPRPSLRTVRAVRRLVRREGVDLVHAYGIPSTLDAFLGPHLRDQVPLVSSMLAPLPAPAHGRLPRRIPLIMVTRNAERDVRKMRPGAVHLLEPPVDVAREHPAVDGSAFRRAWGLEDGIPTVVIVSRLNWLRHQDKQGGIERAIQAVALLARDTPARLVIVGGGPAQPEVAAQAEQANAALGWDAVIMTGPLVDPGPAYAAADVVVGQAQSVLRGMAFGKAAVVVGDGGFSEIVTRETVAQFLDFGWWGVAAGEGSPDRLHGQLRTLLRDDALRANLGRFGREFVADRYSLEAAGRWLEQVYEHTRAEPPAAGTMLPDTLRVLAWITASRTKQRLRPALEGLQRRIG